LGAAQSPSLDPKYVPLAQQLLSAPTDADRFALLDAHKDLAVPELVMTLNELAGQQFDRQQYEPGLAFARAACSVANRLGDLHGQAVCAMNAGLCLGNLYRRQEAFTEFDHALSLFRQLNSAPDLIRALNATGVNFHRAGDLNTALPYLEQAAAEADRTGDEVGIAQSNTNLASLYKDNGRYRDAVRCYLRALELIRKRPGMERRVALVMNNLGGAYYDQHELDLAITYHQQAMALREKLNVPGADLASSVLNLGVDYNAAGRPDKAIPLLDRALQLTEGANNLRSRMLTLYNYGMILHRSGRVPEALPKLAEALEIAARIGDHETAMATRVVRGEIAYEQARYADAASEVEPVSDFARRENLPRLLIRADDVLGVSLQRLGRKEEAEAALAEAIRVTEQLRAELPGERQAMARYASDEIATYRHMVQMQIENGRAEVALAYAERSKARALLDVLQSGGDDIARYMTGDERKKESALAGRLRELGEQMSVEARRSIPDRKRLTAMGAEMEVARNEHRAFEMALYTAHPRLRVERVAFEPSAAGELIGSLPDPDTALLEYAITDEGAHLFVVTRSRAGADVRHYSLRISRAAIDREIQAFRQQVATRDLDYRQTASSLYNRLIEPAKAQLKGKTTLIVVPDGALWQLPFQALVSPSGRHLLEDHAIFFTPSLSVLHEMQKVHESRRLTTPRLLAIDAALAPVARREVEALRQLYGPANVRIYTGAEADQERIKQEAPNYEVLHFAAHGVFEDRHPMDSYLVLAKAGKADAGVLQAREMMSLDLRADLVVLSGCETGRGVTGNGEGLIGMSWALFIAGSPSTVASQWKVDAESTSQFMAEFHKRVRRSEKAKALQAAALSVMQKPQFRHPFYWSGFVLMGEGF
jgi:CHAT domain-containing protein/tetratricopeptide (TPR) repeat protein